MKKLAAILMTVAVVAAMTGCGKTKETTEKLEPTKTTVETVADIADDNAIVNLKSLKREDAPNMVGKVGGWSGDIENLDIDKNEEETQYEESASTDAGEEV